LSAASVERQTEVYRTHLVLDLASTQYCAVDVDALATDSRGLLLKPTIARALQPLPVSQSILWTHLLELSGFYSRPVLVVMAQFHDSPFPYRHNPDKCVDRNSLAPTSAASERSTPSLHVLKPHTHCVWSSVLPAIDAILIALPQPLLSIDGSAARVVKFGGLMARYPMHSSSVVLSSCAFGDTRVVDENIGSRRLSRKLLNVSATSALLDIADRAIASTPVLP
jgi:hypothetical protein